MGEYTMFGDVSPLAPPFPTENLMRESDLAQMCILGNQPRIADSPSEIASGELEKHQKEHSEKREHWDSLMLLDLNPE